MAQRPTHKRHIRNIQKNQDTYLVSLPVEDIQKLGWRDRQKVVVKRVGKRFIIEDWPAKKKTTKKKK